MFFVWALAIIACLLLVFCALIFSSCGPKDSGVPITTEPPAQSESPLGGGRRFSSPEGGDTQGGGGGTQGGEPGSETATDAPVSSVLLPETEDAGQEYIDKLTFLGDSTTYGLKFYEVLTGGKNTTQVWTPANGTLTLYNYAKATIVFPRTVRRSALSTPSRASSRNTWSSPSASTAWPRWTRTGSSRTTPPWCRASRPPVPAPR